MLDRRLVEFTLRHETVAKIPRNDQRRSLFRHAVGDLFPPSIDWELVKREMATADGAPK